MHVRLVWGCTLCMRGLFCFVHTAVVNHVCVCRRDEVQHASCIEDRLVPYAGAGPPPLLRTARRGLKSEMHCEVAQGAKRSSASDVLDCIKRDGRECGICKKKDWPLDLGQLPPCQSGPRSHHTLKSRPRTAATVRRDRVCRCFVCFGRS